MINNITLKTLAGVHTHTHTHTHTDDLKNEYKIKNINNNISLYLK